MNWMKLLSGQLFLCYCVGIAFLWMVYTMAISQEQATAIITMGMGFYFGRKPQAPTA